MRKYWLIFRAALQTGLTYRVSILLRLARDLLMPIFFITLWGALYRGKQEISGFTFQAIATYYILVKIIDQFYGFEPARIFSQDVKSGDLSNYIGKPLTYFFYLGSQSLGKRIARISLTFVVIAILFVFFPRFVHSPAGISLWFWTMIIVIVSWMLIYEIAFSIGALAFWFSETWNIRGAVEQLSMILGGLWIPISFFPNKIESVLNLMPFKYLYYYPVQVFQGKIDNTAIQKGLMVQISWLVAMSFIVWLLWKRGISHFESYGR